VLLQFLVETMVLASFGGLLGILLALGTSLALARVLQVSFVLEGGIIAIAFLFSAAVGIVFGFFPARRAARLDPIEALRHEVEHRGPLLAARDFATSRRGQGDGARAALDNSRVLSTRAEVAWPHSPRLCRTGERTFSGSEQLVDDSWGSSRDRDHAELVTGRLGGTKISSLKPPPPLMRTETSAS